MPIHIREVLQQAVLPCLVLSLGGTSLAQTAADATRPALPSKLQYVSPLRAYKAYTDQPVESWREANDRVGRIGGWRAYAKEIQTGEAAKQAPQEPAKGAASPADPHAGQNGEAKR
jgi:hypothetical protein